MPDVDWRALNRANWDERVPIHLAAPIYDPTPLRAGLARKNAIEEAELGTVDGLRLLHLQCHFGRDTLILAQRGATVVGLDFSPRRSRRRVLWPTNSASQIVPTSSRRTFTMPRTRFLNRHRLTASM